MVSTFHVFSRHMIHVDIWQTPTQYCKAIILQLKTKKPKLCDNVTYLKKALTKKLMTSNTGEDVN